MDLDHATAGHSDQNPDMRERNIIEEMNALNQQMQNPSTEVYKLSSLWDKNPPNVQYNKNIEIILKEILNHMIKIDTSLTKLESVLSAMESETKRKHKSFWDNFRL